MSASELSQALVDSLETGLPYSIAFAGVWLMFRVLRDFDITVDASFASGAAAAALVLTSGQGPWLALGAALSVGAAAGGLTFAVHRLLGLPVVLSSIIVAVGLFSVNLRLMGQPNVNLIDQDTVTARWTEALGTGPADQWAVISVFALFVVVVGVVLTYFLRTQFGLAVRASGINPTMTRAQGFSPALALFAGLVICNALTGMSGALVAQGQGFADVNMGTGTIIFGVTAILLGETVCRGRGPLWGLAAVLVGTIAYRFILAMAFRLGVAPQDFQGMTAIIVICAVAVGLLSRRSGRRGGLGPFGRARRWLKGAPGADASATKGA